MMIRADQHADDWAEVAVDYLDGQLDQDTRQAVDAHLAACPECAARLRRQQYVVTVLQETAFDDPPEDLEYRSIGELIFPSPGTQPVIRPPEEKRIYRTPRWARTLRAWLPATVAVCALLAAVVGYQIARSDSGGDLTADSARMAIPTTIAAGVTTTAGAMSESAATGVADATTMAAATTTTVLAGVAPPEAQELYTFEATEDPKAMITALESAQAPTYVAFRAATTERSGTNQGTTGTGAPTDTTAAGGPETTAAPATETTAGSTVTITGGTLSADQAAALLQAIQEFTGLDPVDRTFWIDGPTFAVFLPRQDAAELVDLIRSIGTTFGLTVTLEGTPPVQAEETCGRLLERKGSFPVLEASRALQPSTWNYDFTTSILGGGSEDGSTAKSLPDADGSHVIVVIWMAE